MSRHTLAAGALALALVGLATPGPAAARTHHPYRVVQLGTLGGPASFAAAINDHGDVTGGADLPSFSGIVDQDSHAFLWRDGAMHDLGASNEPAGHVCSCSVGLAIDTAGNVAGGDLIGESGTSAVWLGGTLMDVRDGVALGINDRDVVVGEYGDEPSDPLPFVLVNGHFRVIHYPGRFSGTAFDVDNAGTIVGELQTGTFGRFGPMQGFVDTGGVVQLLNGAPSASARAIDEAGTIVGWASTPSGQASHAFVAGTDLTVHDLGTLGGRDSQANAVAATGTIVGWADTTRGRQHAFVRFDRRLVDLNRLVPRGLGLELVDAAGVNDMGEIAATAVPRGGGPTQAVLLIPA